MPSDVRLQKILSQAGVASRRVAEEFIRQGRVTVQGKTVTTLGSRADPTHDDVRVDGRRIRLAPRRRYLLVNKPRGYIVTRRDPQHRPTVLDLVPHVREYLYPVGRLDYESEGLLILTNDGDLAAGLTHPRHGVEREYEARIRGVPDGPALFRLSQGVVIDGRRTAPARARLLRRHQAPGGSQAVVALILREGRNQQVRKMCEAVGHPVVRLRRVRIGPVQDPALRPGQARDLTPQEVALLRRAAGLPTPSGDRSRPR